MKKEIYSLQYIKTLAIGSSLTKFPPHYIPYVLIFVSMKYKLNNK